MVLKNETKAKKLPKKLEKSWVAYLIDTTAGDKLMMISLRDHISAEKLQQILVTAVNDMYAKRRRDFLDDPGGFVYATQILLRELVGNFLAHSLTTTLLGGMPVTRILTQQEGPHRIM